MSDHGYTEFRDRARMVVEAEVGLAHRMINEGMLGEGFWHPNGFATFVLKDIEDFGLLRIHIWPKNLRRAVPHHPQIHQHCFHLYSHVLTGVYRERQYCVRGASCPTFTGGPRDSAVLYRVIPPEELGRDQLEVDDTPQKVEPTTAMQEYKAGTSHELPCGIFHSTPISPQAQCSTLALLSRPVVGVPDLLVGKPGFRGLHRSRPRVVVAELEEMCAQARMDLP